MTTIHNLLRSGTTLSLVLVSALVLPACTTSSEEPSLCPGSGASVAVAGDEVALCADNLEFDAIAIQATAGEQFTINFTNAESQPHNVAVYIQEGSDSIIIGEIITGPDATNQVVVPALEPGTYYFRCDVHPEMEGEIVVS
jgi:plastocyanin